MEMSSHPGIVSGAILLTTGVYGFIKTSSKPSLFGGAGLASVFFSAAYLIRKTDQQVVGHSLAAFAGTLALVLGIKRYKVKSARPRVGPYALLLVGIFNVPYQYFKAYEWSRY